jgi:hypothetical protein
LESQSQPDCEDPFTASAFTSKAHLQRDIRFAFTSGIAYTLFYKVASLIPYNNTATVASTTLIAMCLILVFTVSFARTLRSGIALGLGFLFSIALLLAFRLTPLSVVGQILPGMDGLVMVALAGCVGVLVSRLFKEMKLLLPAAVVLAMVDLYVVFGGGLVTQAQSGKSPVAQTAMKALTVDLPTTQAKQGAEPIRLAIGFADFLFIAVFFACFLRFNIPARRTFLLLTGLLILYMLAVALLDLALPALVPMAVIIIATNWKYFEYDRSEKFALLYAGLIVAALFGFLVWKSRQSNALPASPPPTESPSPPESSPKGNGSALLPKPQYGETAV